MSARLHQIQWTHPNLGEITETACIAHEHEILRALRTLGVGCIGSLSDSGRGCDRCFNTEGAPRQWLRGLAA